jgi:hypothetical protein
MRNNFLLVNFPQGAAGKFLSSILMASPSVAHFDEQIETCKTPDLCLDYIQKSFTSDKKNWIKNEPNHGFAWNLTFISSKYPRGDDLSIEEFEQLCNIHGTAHFKKMVIENKKILLPWHKVNIPDFFVDADKICVILDQNSMTWFDRALWEKHYDYTGEKLVLKEHDPSQNPKLKKYFDQFNNPMYSYQPLGEFYKQNIIDNPVKQLFNSVSKFDSRKNNVTIMLSEILTLDIFQSAIQNIENMFNLIPIDREFINKAHNHWRNLHDY